VRASLGVTPGLQEACIAAAEEGVREAMANGWLAKGDVIGAAHLGAIRTMRVVHAWLVAEVDRHLAGM